MEEAHLKIMEKYFKGGFSIGGTEAAGRFVIYV